MLIKSGLFRCKRFLFKILLLLLLSLSVRSAVAIEQSYWVWQRTDPLLPQETSDLNSAGVTELYWHVGTVSWDGTTWHWREHLPLDWKLIRAACPGIEVVPVLRIEAGSGPTFPKQSRAPLVQQLQRLLAEAGARKLQIDFESPDRLIGEYTDFLQELKDQRRSWRLSITALAHWSKFGPQLAGCADEITPMFYDLDPKQERLGADGMPPLLGPGIGAELQTWRGFPVPWKAGLPNFSRVTLIAADGHNRGNLRGWSWNDILFAPFLQPRGATLAGQTLFTVNRDAVLGFTPLHPQEQLDIRYPDRTQLGQAEQASETMGAQGVIYFRLADGNDPSGYSVRDLGEAQPRDPALHLSRDSSGRYVLTNIGTTDLMPTMRGTGASDCGYALELEAQSPIWREAVAGDFARASASADATTGEGLGTAHLQFWFAHLAVGTSLTSGYVDEADHPKTVSLRWRIRNLLKEDSWHALN